MMPLDRSHILCHFQDIARCCAKIANFSYPRAFGTPC